jgi:hypothetical protein
MSQRQVVANASPLDVEGVRLRVGTDDIVAAVRDGRERLRFSLSSLEVSLSALLLRGSLAYATFTANQGAHFLQIIFDLVDLISH